MGALAWVQLHWGELAEALGALYLVASIVVSLTPTPRDEVERTERLGASIVVSLTPTPRDDQWLRALAARLSFLSARDVNGWLSIPGSLPVPRDTTELDESEDERAEADPLPPSGENPPH